jgi:hypothetical protein
MIVCSRCGVHRPSPQPYCPMCMDQLEARDHETDHALAVAIARSRLGMRGSKWHDVDQRLARAVLRAEDGHDAILGAENGGSSPTVRQPESDLSAQVDVVDPARTAAQHGVVVDQPPPIVTNRPPTWELVIKHVAQMQQEGAHAYLVVDEDVFPLVLDDMRARDTLGRARYGTPLTAGNGRDHLIDAYQELLDGCVYLMNELVERNVPLTGQLTEEEIPDWPDRSHLQGVRALCLLQIRSAIQLRALVKGRTELSVAAQQWRAGRAASAGGVTPDAEGEDNKIAFGALDTCWPSVVARAKAPVVSGQGVPIALDSQGNDPRYALAASAMSRAFMMGVPQHEAPVFSPAVLRGLQLINHHLNDSGHDWRTGTDVADVHAAQQWLAGSAGGTL